MIVSQNDLQRQNGSYYTLSDGVHDIRFFVNNSNTDPISAAIREKNNAILYEPLELLTFYDPKGTFLDIGAHLGLYSFVLGAKGYKVYAFEANAGNVEQMALAQTRNNFDITIVPYAVTEKSGAYSFYNDGPYGALSNDFLKQEDCVVVKGTSIDDWSRQADPANVTLIKMDIEGAELEALKGMASFLECAGYPVIYSEFNGWCLSWSQRTAKDYFAAFRQLGYQPYRIRNRRTAEIINVFLQPKCVQNFLFVHESNSAIWNGKTIIDSRPKADDLFFTEALRNTDPCSAYYYAWTLLHEAELLQHSKAPAFLAYLQTFSQPYNMMIYDRIMCQPL